MFKRLSFGIDRQNLLNAFFLFSAGLSQPAHDGQVAAQLDAQESLGGVSHFTGTLDAPGVYFVERGATLLGLTTHFTFEDMARSYHATNSFGLHTYNLSFSALRFFSSREQSGFYARGDLGYSYMIRTLYAPGVVDNEYSSGVMVLFGGGYAWPILESSRLLVGGEAYSIMHADHYIRGLSFNVGYLF
jgi:hypothetical protein